MDETLDLPSENPPLPPLSPKLSHAEENIDSILDDHIISTRDVGTQHCLIKWRGRPEPENSWITEMDLRRLDLTYLSISTASRSFPVHTQQSQFFLTQGPNDEDITPLSKLH